MRKFHVLAIIILSVILCSCGGLLYNAKVGNVEGIKEALEKGQSIEHRNEVGSTALIIAAYSQKADAVEYLCKSGANVNAQDNFGRTALIHAAYYNSVPVAKILLEYGADKNLKDRYGNTPLQYAENYDYDRMMNLLNNKN